MIPALIVKLNKNNNEDTILNTIVFGMEYKIFWNVITLPIASILHSVIESGYFLGDISLSPALKLKTVILVTVLNKDIVDYNGSHTSYINVNT
jgi:hypothetical protein